MEKRLSVFGNYEDGTGFNPDARKFAKIVSAVVAVSLYSNGDFSPTYQQELEMNPRTKLILQDLTQSEKYLILRESVERNKIFACQLVMNMLSMPVADLSIAKEIVENIIAETRPTGA